MAPAAVHIPAVQAALRKDFAVAAQNCWVKAGGAFTGELRWGSGGCRRCCSTGRRPLLPRALPPSSRCLPLLPWRPTLSLLTPSPVPPVPLPAPHRLQR